MHRRPADDGRIAEEPEGAEEQEQEEEQQNPEADDITKRETVLVCVRVRPLNRKERKSAQSIAWKLDGSTIVQADLTKSQGRKPEKYAFDHLWGENIANSDIFNQIGFSVVKATMDGFHGIVFAYGQTSSGKTYTIHGSEEDPGLIPRSVEAMFEYIENTPDRDFVIRVAYMEIYNEVVNDLIDPAKTNLKIREDAKLGVFVDGLSEAPVMSAEQVYALLASGESHRHIGRTDYNEVSSRSHTVFQIMVQSQSVDPKRKTVLDSKLSLVDLAGSENTSKVGSENTSRVKETGHINKSLLALSSVIFKISEGKSGAHIPYRDSKLTRILQQSLNGSACISVICALSPSSGNFEESVSTLKFASRAKEIKNTATVNEKSADVGTVIAKFKEEIDALRRELENAQKGTAPAVGPAVDLAAIEEAKDRAEQEKAELENKIERMKKLLLHSHSNDEVFSLNPNASSSSGGDQGAHARRPSYLAMFGATQRANSIAPGTPSGPTRGVATGNTGKGLERLRAGSVGLNEETGNKSIDDLLIHPAHQKRIQRLETLKNQSSQKESELERLEKERQAVYGDLQEEDKRITALLERKEDLNQLLKEKDSELDALTDHLRELEGEGEGGEEEEYEAVPAPKKVEKQSHPAPGEKGSNVQPPATVNLTVACRHLVKRKSTLNPLMGFFVRNDSTGLFEYEGRTELVANNGSPNFERKFTVRNHPTAQVRFSVYDVDNEKSIQAGDFVGSVTCTLGDIVSKSDTSDSGDAAFLLEIDHPSNSPNKPLLVVSLGRETKTQKKARKAKQKKEQLKKKSEELKNRNSALERELLELKKKAAGR